MGVIPVAFAVVPSGKPGLFYSVKLRNVVAERVEHLVPGNDKVTSGAFACQRAVRAMQITSAKRKMGG
jgi:pyrrolidone-carboxylate peptidase